MAEHTGPGKKKTILATMAAFEKMPASSGVK
jgi:hypothetical protein